ncbi:ACP phosphodiesterase [Enterobacteriaceae bacterium ESL0689]|nr:ACP phosphodiesterase [Enterobacteriaceae bacterium ESL0689]
MNFLAHLHLAHLAGSSLPGNLVADFIRGNPTARYSAEIVAGIFMHRRVDVFTDNLAQVTATKAWFRPLTRRVAPIALDIIWDHFLSRHWDRLSPALTLDQFSRYAETQISACDADFPPAFTRLNAMLWSERWLERYQEKDFIQSVLNGMARRRPRLQALSDCWQDFHTHYDKLEQGFWHFYPQMMALAQQQKL